MYSKNKVLYLILLFLFTTCQENSQEVQSKKIEEPQNLKVCLQPFGNIQKTWVKEVEKSIETYYGFEVDILPHIPLPKSSRCSNIKALKNYNPSPNLYRADTLLRVLRRNIPKEYDYIVGLTNQDISTTKKRNGKIKEPAWMYTNWGIFGLGFRPGKSCVVSTFRLWRYADQKMMLSRLRKIATHELGHNLGLPHCPNKHCFMQDALERMSTIDNAPETLCDECKIKIASKYHIPSLEE